MNFESIIKNISATLAFVVVFLLFSGLYLTYKGFGMTPEGIVLSEGVYASEIKESNTPVNDNAFIEDRVMGSDTAPITIYEFSSFTCGHCSHFHNDVISRLKTEYVDNDKVKIVFNDFMLGKNATVASVVARCMDKDKYFPFIELIFKKQNEWGYSEAGLKTLMGYATASGLSKDRIDACMANKEDLQKLMNDRNIMARKYKIMGTPSLVITGIGEDEIIHGAVEYDIIKNVLDSKLETVNKK